MRNIVYILTLLCLTAVNAGAQSMYHVTHSTGTQVIGGINVTVTPINNAGVYPGTNCGAGPYFIGQGIGSGTTSTAYKFRFSKPVSAARFQITASDSGEIISFLLNDSVYALTSGNVTNYPGSCGFINGWVVNSGQLKFTGWTNNNSEVFIADSIASITISDVNVSAGSVFSFHFLMDTTTYVEKMSDSVYCVGDSMHFEYTATGTYFNGNQFKFQLSDKNGNFTSPTTLGIITGTTSGILHCVTPALPSGDGYRLRIVSTMPVDTSDVSVETIGIGNPPVVIAYNTGPGCEGDTLKVGVNEYSHVTERTWNGPGLLPNFLIRIATLFDVKLSDAGMYYVTVEDNGCFAYDSTLLVIHPNPVHTIGASNSPICEGDTLKLQGNVDSAGVINTWFPQGGGLISGKDVIIANAKFADSGRYVLATKLNGCTSKDTAYVIVKPTPVPKATSNSPLCMGDKLLLNTDCNVVAAQFSWSGPAGFNSASADTFVNNAAITSSGNYAITASYNGCSTTETLHVLVKPVPPVPVVSSNSPVCETGDIILSSGNVTTDAGYTWAGPDNFTNKNYDVTIKGVTPKAGGIYVLRAEIDGCFKEATVNVTVNPLPVQPLISSNSPLRIGKDLKLGIANPEEGTSYSWKGPNGFMSYEFTPILKNAGKKNSGTYTLLAERKGCLRSSLLEVIIDEVTDTGTIVLFPNANDGNFFVKALVFEDQPMAIRITNTAGQTVYEETTGTVNKVLLRYFNLKDMLASGVYSFIITINNNIKVIPFVVDRQR